VKTLLIICGALAREVIDIVQRHGWDAKVVGVSGLDHLLPEKIPGDVEAKIVALRDRFERVIVVYGDCGTGGALDRVLERHGIERVWGPHCYEMYSGPLFQRLMEEEIGTFVLTDFLVRTFRGSVIRGLGLDRFPELKDQYFRHYTRVVYLAQTHDPELVDKAQGIADFLELRLEIRYTGFRRLEDRLVAIMEAGESATSQPGQGPDVVPVYPFQQMPASPNGSQPRRWRRGRRHVRRGGKSHAG
jgi:hypothetical protein